MGLEPRGAPVFGAASMGALRGAELEPYGMEGVGAIFTAYRDGVLRDDDEVAITHAGPEDGYLALSEAMVNIRCTLGTAAAAGVISRRSLLVLQEAAKALFYPERTYPAILERVANFVPAEQLAALRAWLPQGRADQKREDALLMLRVMREALSSPSAAAPKTDFIFAYTAYWDRLRLTLLQPNAAPTHSGADRETTLVLDELRVDARAYRAARVAAVARLLGLERARRHGLAAPEDALQEETARLEETLAPSRIDDWLCEQRLDAASFSRLIEEDALLRRLDAFMLPEIPAATIDHLKLTGAYGRLLARAQAKRQLLARRDAAAAPDPDDGVQDHFLWHWYFVERLGHSTVPELNAYATAMGYQDVMMLRRAALAEYLYSRAERPSFAR